ncbi:helix-turn-helix domain-containing protein [Nocardia testacea]|uniref:helix-turn-helix domain-containing protein n=1 Tax=Nocardia testacea TaxID=248551 RepID=UPI0033E0ACCE
MRGEDIRAARKARGWSLPALVAALRDAAEREGIHLMEAPSLKVALSRWENGHVKPDKTHSRLLAQVLSIPYAGDALDQGVDYPVDATSAIVLMDSLAEGDHQNDPALLSASAITSSASSKVVTGYLFGQSLSLATPEPLFGVAIADQIRSTVARMMTMDFQRGGGHVRQVLMRYYRAEVVPQLHAVHPALARREIFSAAAEVAQLLGWSAYDAGRHAAASRYFVQGLRMAAEAGDHLLGARLLANLSHQANFVGNYQDAVMYARAAQTALRGQGTPSVETMCVMMEARGLASLADQRGASAAIHRADQLFERRNSDEPTWIGYYDAAELAGDTSHCFRDLQLAPQTRASIRAALTDGTPPRTRAFIQMVAGDAALIAGDLEEAGALAAAAVINADGLQSARYLRYLSDFRRRLPPGAERHPALTEFIDLVRVNHPAVLAQR